MNGHELTQPEARIVGELLAIMADQIGEDIIGVLTYYGMFLYFPPDDPALVRLANKLEAFSKLAVYLPEKKL